MSILRRCLLFGLVASAISCSEPQCCIDDYPATYAVLYGMVRLPSQAPASNVLVRAGEEAGVRTDADGRYRLATSLRGLSARVRPVTVTAFPPAGSVGLADSTRVEAPVPFFDTRPVRDSARVDIVLDVEP